MINTGKVKTMTKLAVYDQRDARKCAPVIECFRSDYIGKELLKSCTMGTIAYILMLVLWVLYNAEELVENINRLDYASMGMDMLRKYIGFIVVFLIVTYIIYAIRYSKGKRKVKEYHRGLHAIIKTYASDDD